MSAPCRPDGRGGTNRTAGEGRKAGRLLAGKAAGAGLRLWSSRRLAVHLALFLIAALTTGTGTALIALDAAEQIRIVHGWPRAEARILAVLGERPMRGGRQYALELESNLPDGRRLRGTTSWRRAHVVTGSWSAPPAPPRPGDRLTVFLDPDDPAHMVPVRAVSAWPLLEAFLALMFGWMTLLVAYAASLSLRELRRRRRAG